MAAKDFIKIVNLHVQRGARYEQCKVLVNLEIRYKTDKFAVFEMYYPIQDERHLVSLIKYVDTNQAPEYHLSRAMVEVILDFLKGIKEEL